MFYSAQNKNELIAWTNRVGNCIDHITFKWKLSHTSTTTPFYDRSGRCFFRNRCYGLQVLSSAKSCSRFFFLLLHNLSWTRRHGILDPRARLNNSAEFVWGTLHKNGAPQDCRGSIPGIGEWNLTVTVDRLCLHFVTARFELQMMSYHRQEATET